MKHFGASDLVGEANDTRNFMQGLGVRTPAPPAQGCCGKGWCQQPRGDGSSLPCVPQGAHSSCPACPRMLTAPSLCTAGCPQLLPCALGPSCSTHWVVLMSGMKRWERSPRR